MDTKPTAPDPTPPPPAAIVTAVVARRLYGLAAVLTVAALIVNVTHPFGWKVDSTAVGLIGLLLVIPIVEQVRKLKFGGLEAEFEQRVQKEIENLQRRVGDIGEQASEPSVSQELPVARASVIATPTPIGRIVWVDDHPENNNLEAAELRRRFDVLQVTSTRSGLREVAKQPDGTAVITDVGREEGERLNADAGLELLQQICGQYPRVPVYVYTTLETSTVRGPELEAAGARLVTSSFTELSREIARDARMSFEAEVERILEEMGAEVDQQHAGLDFVATVGLEELAIGVEAKDFRRTPKAHAVDAAAQLLGMEIANGTIASGIVVAPRDVFIPAQRDRAPDGVHLVPITKLAETVRRLSQG